LPAYISQKAVNHKSFPSFSLFSFPISSTQLPAMVLQQQLLFLLFSPAGVGIVGVGVGVGVGVDAGAGVISSCQW
jgi:hypothetical protein